MLLSVLRLSYIEHRDALLVSTTHQISHTHLTASDARHLQCTQKADPAERASRRPPPAAIAPMLCVSAARGRPTCRPRTDRAFSASEIDLPRRDLVRAYLVTHTQPPIAGELHTQMLGDPREPWPSRTIIVDVARRLGDSDTMYVESTYSPQRGHMILLEYPSRRACEEYNEDNDTDAEKISGSGCDRRPTTKMRSTRPSLSRQPREKTNGNVARSASAGAGGLVTRWR